MKKAPANGKRKNGRRFAKKNNKRRKADGKKKQANNLHGYFHTQKQECLKKLKELQDNGIAGGSTLLNLETMLRTTENGTIVGQIYQIAKLKAKDGNKTFKDLMGVDENKALETLKQFFYFYHDGKVKKYLTLEMLQTRLQNCNDEQEAKELFKQNITILQMICLKKAFQITSNSYDELDVCIAQLVDHLEEYGTRLERGKRPQGINPAALNPNQTMRFEAPVQNTFDDGKIHVQSFAIKGTDLTDESAIRMSEMTGTLKELKKYVISADESKDEQTVDRDSDDYKTWVNDEQNPHNGKLHQDRMEVTKLLQNPGERLYQKGPFDKTPFDILTMAKLIDVKVSDFPEKFTSELVTELDSAMIRHLGEVTLTAKAIFSQILGDIFKEAVEAKLTNNHGEDPLQPSLVLQAIEQATPKHQESTERRLLKKRLSEKIFFKASEKDGQLFAKTVKMSHILVDRIQLLEKLRKTGSSIADEAITVLENLIQEALSRIPRDESLLALGTQHLTPSFHALKAKISDGRLDDMQILQEFRKLRQGITTKEKDSTYKIAFSCEKEHIQNKAITAYFKGIKSAGGYQQPANSKQNAGNNHGKNSSKNDQSKSNSGDEAQRIKDLENQLAKQKEETERKEKLLQKWQNNRFANKSPKGRSTFNGAAMIGETQSTESSPGTSINYDEALVNMIRKSDDLDEDQKVFLFSVYEKLANK